MASYMITMRTQDGGDTPSPTARYLKLDDTGAETELVKTLWEAQIIAQFPKAADDTRHGDIIVFVHGFNVDFQSAVAAHHKMAKAAADNGFLGQFISFDWPSKGLVFAYLSDREHARLAANALVTSGISLLRDAQTQNCRINLHVMAHSMGCFVVQQAFIWSYQDVPPDWRVGQLILVAADVDATVFSADTPTAKAFAAHAGRLTAYCNRYDKALAVSNAKRLELAARMGRVGLPDDAPASMCEVDCSELFDKALPSVADHLAIVKTHGFYFDQPVFWQDVVLTLAGGIDRGFMPTRQVNAPNTPDNRFRIRTAAIPAADYAGALAKAAQSPSFG